MSESDYATPSTLKTPTLQFPTSSITEDFFTSSVAGNKNIFYPTGDKHENNPGIIDKIKGFFHRGEKEQTKRLQQETEEQEEREQAEREARIRKEEKKLEAQVRALRAQQDDTDPLAGNFKFVPKVFMGITTANFANSLGYDAKKKSAYAKNSFYQLRDLAMNSQTSWQDRIQSIRYMQRIPHIKRYEIINKCMEVILQDTQYPFADRYHFFANNEAEIKLDYEIVNYCHRYVFTHFDSLQAPLLYKILSAQHMLTQFPADTYDLAGLQNFLLETAQDEQMSVNTRAECADILDRAGYGDAKIQGKMCIIELGQLYVKNKRTTIYTNSQNVHDVSITEKVMATLRKLIEECPPSHQSGDIYETLHAYRYESMELQDKVLSAYRRVIIDTARYDGYTILNVMLMVWTKIQSSELKSVLVDRLVEELSEMDETCSTGHLSRVLNVLSGFFEGYDAVAITYQDQLRSNIFAKIAKTMSALSVDLQDQINNEMTENYKPTINTFLEQFDAKNGFYTEFVDAGYVTADEFKTIYDKALVDYFGLTLEEIDVSDEKYSSDTDDTNDTSDTSD